MRSIEDQMNEIRRRKDIYAKNKILKRKMIGEISTGVVCLALMIAVAFVMPTIEMRQDKAPLLQYGSVIHSLPVIGYILIALLAFAMGISVTLACFHWKEHQRKEQEL